jgi:hypothetical protein
MTFNNKRIFTAGKNKSWKTQLRVEISRLFKTEFGEAKEDGVCFSISSLLLLEYFLSLFLV